MEVIRGGFRKKGQTSIEEAKSAVGDLASRAGGAVTAALDSEPARSLAKLVDGGLSQAGEWVEGAEHLLTTAGKKVSSTIKKYPLQAVILGLGLGALLSAVLRPRKE